MKKKIILNGIIRNPDTSMQNIFEKCFLMTPETIHQLKIYLDGVCARNQRRNLFYCSNKNCVTARREDFRLWTMHVNRFINFLDFHCKTSEINVFHKWDGKCSRLKSPEIEIDSRPLRFDSRQIEFIVFFLEFDNRFILGMHHYARSVSLA